MNLHYEKYGDHSQKLIILHGLFGSADNWTSLGKQLSRRFTVFLIDQRNHGKSLHDSLWNYQVMARDLKEFISNHNIDKPIIIGHSMGGKTAMKFACTYPDLLQKLIVVDISPKYYPVHHKTIIEGLQSVAKQRVSSRKQADEILQKYIPELPVRQFLIKNLVREETCMEWRMNLDVIDHNIENVGESLSEDENTTIPTLFIRGSHSDYILDVDKEFLLKHFPKSTLETVDNAGHWLHAEQPKAFLALIEKFTQ